MHGELEQLGERIAEQAAHLDAAMHRLLTDLREFDARGGWHVQGAATCAHWLAWRVGWDLVTARDHVRVARKLAEFARIDDALRRGELSYSKVRAMLRVATPENEALLLDHARLMTASQLEKLCRKYALVQRHDQDSHPEIEEQRRYVRRRDLEDGMVKIEAVLHPEEAELVWTMLDHAASRLARESAAAATATGGTAGRDSAASAGTGDGESSHAESDFAESPAVAGPCCAAARAPAGTQDSAESAGTGDVETRRAESDSAGSPAGEPCCAAASTAAGGLDSAESAGTAEGESSHAESDSAESAAAAGPCCATASIPAGTLVAGRPESTASSTVACSVEGWTEWTGSATLGCSAGEQTEWIGPTPVGDSAACSEVAGRSLLDRLLAEADALRRIEPTAADAAAELRDSPEPAPSQHEAEPRREQPARRGASALRDRAAAARKAFNRADALVELAQGYLRGDRPDRSPIEVTLTVPASLLRDEPADPVEVGEIGESFLSGETARRLSCDAGVVEIIEDDQGAPLSVGRKQRTIGGARCTGAIARAPTPAVPTACSWKAITSNTGPMVARPAFRMPYWYAASTIATSTSLDIRSSSGRISDLDFAIHRAGWWPRYRKLHRLGSSAGRRSGRRTNRSRSARAPSPVRGTVPRSTTRGSWGTWRPRMALHDRAGVHRRGGASDRDRAPRVRTSCHTTSTTRARCLPAATLSAWMKRWTCRSGEVRSAAGEPPATMRLGRVTAEAARGAGPGDRPPRRNEPLAVGG